ncbi:MAG: thiamine pyrophosphate-dependent enzyme [Alphaproteobacteria bacterium]|jgi:acetolactate synthase-1/2/3 large subunit|nr:thiamine pyrophosphate-dependent enzyme [Alphaproteobacteria bacterium]
MLSLDRPPLDWLHMARSMGVEAARVDDLAALARALEAGLHSEGPYLIELVM